MVNILFVCLGNICRSPMAEALFKDHVQRRGLNHLFKIDSAGTGDWHVGQPPHEGTQKKLQENNISFSELKGRQIQEEDITTFDYIIAMDRENKRDIEALMPDDDKVHAKIITFMSFLNNQPYEDVPDPYFTGNFDEVYDIVSRGTEKLLHYICEREEIYS